ncbi:YccF domain-containing protein [Conexibacter sp. W3-3-2]|uniref:YccF domain-containing protein n=1 Tax=Conexibacter sp. W3-3-2 TaxID=2675227 RepID=UPI00132881D6|nr:YccF domain-containing protein [Conexibacter sp. W3-3-2]MTD46612.1 YccF domain-containing protein [Conexibacter sp. W3-3-2]
MRLALNLIWLVLAGFWLFVGYAFAGLVCFVFIITIPFGVASFRMAFYALWPFGRTVVPQPGKTAGSTAGNLLWFALGGWWLALVHLLTGLLLCLTVIGIPLGVANLKLLTVSLRPFGREIVSIEEARARGLTGEAGFGT